MYRLRHVTTTVVPSRLLLRAGISILLLTTCQKGSDEFREHLTAANAAYGSKDYAQAIVLYEKAYMLAAPQDVNSRIPAHFFIASSHHLYSLSQDIDSEARDWHRRKAEELYRTTLEMIDKISEPLDILETYRDYTQDALEQIK